MKSRTSAWILAISVAALVTWACSLDRFADSLGSEPTTALQLHDGGGNGNGGGSEPEVAGNNLSYPVIWAEGYAKTLPGTAGMVPQLDGEWWYWWGTDADGNPLSAPPDPDDESLCDDGTPGQATGDAPGEGWVKAYLQKDPGNLWQAQSVDGSGEQVVVDLIDWGDNLESVDWYTRSKVRVEVVLFKELTEPLLEYQMRHVSGLGIDEVHGLAATAEDAPMQGPGTQATVYSHCARLTIQKLLVERGDQALDALEWVPGEGWTGDVIEAPLYNSAVYAGGDGPGFYSAEINVKGRVIYGYTWNVRADNADAADYRITFSLDDLGPISHNTKFQADVTQILLPLEAEAIAAAEEEPGGGAVAVIDYDNNLTYMDIRILQKGGGGGH